MPTLQDVLDELLGAGETALTLGTGAISGAVGMPYGLYKGITGGNYGKRAGVEQADRELLAFMDRNTYMPRTRTGQENLSALAKIMEASKLPPVIPQAVMLSSIPRAAALAQAERLGMSAEKALEVPVKQIYEKGGLSREMLLAMGQGTQSKIIPPNVARNIDMPVNLPQSPEFLRAVANEPSAQVTNEGLLINLMRQQKPEQSGAESVRTGVFYLPEGQAKNMRHYKGPQSTATYGGPESIRGETLVKNPLFVKGATGGKAPEAAFDAIMGKGAMKQLDSDVFSVISGRNMMTQKDPQAYLEQVQNLLSKYGADPRMASEIIRNSKKGNQLRYALQENIIANTVRNAGHDAVLGYGKGRGDKGEFFSELFDVRERLYPTPEGDFELMPQFNDPMEVLLQSRQK
jgi:hypothetical protein